MSIFTSSGPTPNNPIPNVDNISHPVGYDGSGGELTVTVAIDPNSLFRDRMVLPTQNAIATWNNLIPTVDNIVDPRFSNVPSNLFDYETVLIHEIGHALGLDHVNESGGYATLWVGPNGIVDTQPGLDGVQGSADDQPGGDDVNRLYFRKDSNDPFDTDLGVVDSTTYSRNLADLPSGDSSVSAATRQVASLLGYGDNTEAVMSVGASRGQSVRSLAASDVAGILYGMSGVDELANTDDDYTLQLQYVGFDNNADIIIDFDGDDRFFSDNPRSVAVAKNNWRSLDSNHSSHGSNIPIVFNDNFQWFFNENDTVVGNAISTLINPIPSSPAAVYSGIGTNQVSWGEPVPDSFSSSLLITPTNFSTDIGSPFIAGNITFTNGTIQTPDGADTGIDGLDLNLELNFDFEQLNLSNAQLSDVRNIDIINTINTDDPEESADYLTIAPPDGTGTGFGNSFHILEGETATATLIARIVQSQASFPNPSPITIDDPEDGFAPQTTSDSPDNLPEPEFQLQFLGFGSVIDGSGFIRGSATSGSNELFGTEDDDELVGGSGQDTIYGFGGNDHLWGDFKNIPELGENDFLDGGAGQDTISGGGGDDQIIGGSGDDILMGEAGNDTLDGGGGNDTASYDRDPSGIIANLAQNQVIDGFGDIDQLSNIENITGSRFDDTIIGDASANKLSGGIGADLILAGAGNDQLDGGVGDDILEGEAGDDFINGGAGDDMMTGGQGDDTFVVSSAGDQVIEQANEGNDTVQATISYTLGDNVENLTLIGGGANNGTGNELDNFIQGNSANNILQGLDGDDTLNGGAGNDLLDGGDGTDLASYADSPTGIKAKMFRNLITSDSEGTDQIIDIEGVIGSDFDDRIVGDTEANILYGGAGDDFIRGRAGDDQLFGDDGDDALLGDDGNDTLDGGTGDDKLKGGEGDDILNGGDGRDRAFGQGGDDEVDGGNGDDFLNGNEGDDRILGGSGNDQLHGQTGEDQLFGESGNDALMGGVGNDILEGGTGNDILKGQGDNDLLNGGAGDDRLFGGDGDDILNGGMGNDLLNGGEGVDTYILELGMGIDQWLSFDVTEDLIGLAGGLQFNQLGIAQEGSRAVISVGEETLAVLNGVRADNLIAQQDRIFTIV